MSGDFRVRDKKRGGNFVVGGEFSGGTFTPNSWTSGPVLGGWEADDERAVLPACMLPLFADESQYQIMKPKKGGKAK